MSPSIKG